MPGLPDTAVIVLIALLLFGPKKLPVLARQLGKLMADFRRASNEFRAQMEEELRISEQADRQKQVAALEAAKPPSPAVDVPATREPEAGYMPLEPAPASEFGEQLVPDSPTELPADSSVVTPIATSGDLNIMPPDTGLPVSRTPSSEAPAAAPTPESELETETLHG